MLLKTNSFIAWRNNWRTHCPSMKSLMGFNCSLSVCVCEWPLCSKLFHSLILSHLAIRSVWFSQRNKWQQLKANFVPLQSFEQTKSSEQKKNLHMLSDEWSLWRPAGGETDGQTYRRKKTSAEQSAGKKWMIVTLSSDQHIGYIEHIAVSQPSSARDT